MRAFARALVPFATPQTVRPLERDFLDRPSASTPTAGQPSISRTAAEAETRIEEAAPEPAAEASAIRAIAPLPCAPGASPFHIKGMSYRGLLRLIDKVVPGGLDAFCAAVSDPRLSAFVRQPFLASARYDILPFLPIFATLARIVDVPFERFVREAAAAQARYDAHTVFKAMWSNATVEKIAVRAGRFGAQYYDFGEFEGASPEPGVLLLRHAELPAYLYPWYGPMHVAYTEECLRMLGCVDVTSAPRGVVACGAREGFSLVSIETELRWRSGEAEA